MKHNGTEAQTVTYNGEEVSTWIHNGVTVFSGVVETVLVTFVDMDGTVLKEQEVPIGSSATPPENPSKAPTYVFKGWSGSFEGVTEDVTIKAVYYPTVHITMSTGVSSYQFPTGSGHYTDGAYFTLTDIDTGTPTTKTYQGYAAGKADYNNKYFNVKVTDSTSRDYELVCSEIVYYTVKFKYLDSDKNWVTETCDTQFKDGTSLKSIVDNYAPELVKFSDVDFTGWENDSAYSSLYANVTFTANYTVYVNFIDELGVATDYQTIVFGGTATPPNTGIYYIDGDNKYMLVDWDGNYKSVIGDTNVYAVYKQVFTISFYWDSDFTQLWTTTEVLEGDYVDYPVWNGVTMKPGAIYNKDQTCYLYQWGPYDITGPIYADREVYTRYYTADSRTDDFEVLRTERNSLGTYAIINMSSKTQRLYHISSARLADYTQASTEGAYGVPRTLGNINPTEVYIQFASDSSVSAGDVITVNYSRWV